MDKDIEAKLKAMHWHEPSPKEIEQRNHQLYEQAQKNPNNLSIWFPKIAGCGFKVPETVIMPISFERFVWLISDDYSGSDIDIYRSEINAFLDGQHFDTNRPLFLKTGNFSGKFCFDKRCKLTDIKQIGQQALDVFYDGMCVGCPPSAELVIREYIREMEDKPYTIYHGMPLTTEFRVFYDFDTCKVLGIFNYWDTETMVKHLRIEEERNNFAKAAPFISHGFEDHKQAVLGMAEENLARVDLKGRWSVDIMFTGSNYYLIDMGIAEQSYYYDRI